MPQYLPGSQNGSEFVKKRMGVDKVMQPKGKAGKRKEKDGYGFVSHFYFVIFS
jgi:hypothetical protein